MIQYNLEMKGAVYGLSRLYHSVASLVHSWKLNGVYFSINSDEALLAIVF